MEQSQNAFEKLADEAYRRFAPTARSYYYTFHRPSVTRGGVPCMVFLGNHSSGKSTLVNWVLGGEPVQESGLAPTDDGFTVLLFGETEEDVCGPAALARLPEEFHALESFGGTFLQHLKVKVRNRELLRTVTLIDTPGMIDSAEGTVSRAYDFEGVVRLLAEVCDMVFFLLDPDKPGTTGETVSVFSKCLAGVEFKLRVLLNKCDAFSSQYDFARTYGTVCWNLARVLRTKDLPKIWTIYSGEDRTNAAFDFSDFNRHRQEFLGVLRDAKARRMDNVYSQALSDFLGLSVRMRVVNHAARSLVGFRAAFVACCGLFLAAGGFLVWHILSTRFQLGNALSLVAAGFAAGLGVLCAHWMGRLAQRVMRLSLARRVDDIFAREYRRELAVGTHENTRQRWDLMRDETAEIVRDAPLHLPFFGEWRRARLDAAARRVFKARTSGT
ncbi:MAG: hypothetical protein ACI4RA_11760 [Kiritimatiellia bacterium]